MKYTLDDVKKSSDKKLFNYISFFAGGGGSSTGYKLAGGNALFINEFVQEAIKTYLQNYPNSNISGKDIREITESDLEIFKGVDILDGSPPCSAFSTAGIREEGWGKEKNYSSNKNKQRVDDLFFEYLRVVNIVQPKIAIAENVKGLTMGKAKTYLQTIIHNYPKNYIVKAKVLNSANYSVPQIRQRLFIIAIRKDVYKEGFDFFPKHHDKILNYSEVVREVNAKDGWINKDTKAYTLWQHTAIGKTFEGASKKLYGKQSNFTYRKISPKTPSPTAMAGHNLYDYIEPRRLSINELKQVQSLPTDYILTGGFDRQAERIGRMVPPLMTKAIAENLYNNFLK